MELKMLESECEWYLGDANEFLLLHRPTGSSLLFKSFVMKNIAFGLMANLLKKNYC